MFKEKYKKTIAKISPDQELIKNTINKINEKTEKPKHKISYLKLVNAIAIVLIMFTVCFAYSKNIIKQEPKINDTADVSQLPTLGNFENLKKIAKKIDNNNRNMFFVTDTAMQESSSEMISNDVSKTNTQVEGVDESDIVKVDKNHVYYVANNSKVVIVDVSNPSDIKLSYEIKYDDNFRPNEIYLKDNKLIVIGANYIVDNEPEKTNSVIYTRRKEYTKAIVYDITDRTKVNKIREVEIEGSCISSRMIGNNIYIASNKWIYSNSILESDVNGEDLKPEYRDTNISYEYNKINYDCIYYFPETEQTNYLIMTGFNIYDNSQANIQTYLGGGQNIYCSENNMYVVKSKYEHDSMLDTIIREIAIAPRTSKTEIYKFGLINGNIAYKGKGEVKGTIINQFSMDENNGYFRIATTSIGEDNKTANNVYVLDKDLKTVGKLENLAIGESIYSVRFMQNKCYMVTFVQVDPLFVIDLSNPTAPQVLGELKIPGYSRYLHPYDENHLIGIGEETEVIENQYGPRVVTTGMKMALFDVSDVNNPKELYSIKIGDSGTYSEILYNHKALLFSKEKNIIAFPIYITNEIDVTKKQQLTFQGAIIYGLDINKGFELKGKISHMQIQNGYQDYNYHQAVKRIVYIKDTIITLSDELIKTSNINTLEQLDTIKLTVEGQKIYY